MKMSRLHLLVHKNAGQNSLLVSQALMTMVKVFKDDPKTGKTFTELAQFAFNAHKGIEALAAEVERLQALDMERRFCMLDIAKGLETHSKDVCWISDGMTATEAILHNIDPDATQGDYPDCIDKLIAELQAERERDAS